MKDKMKHAAAAAVEFSKSILKKGVGAAAAVVIAAGAMGDTASAQTGDTIDIAPITTIIDTGKGYIKTIGTAGLTVAGIFLLYRLTRRGINRAV